MSQLGSSQEKIDTIIREAREKKASDIHLSEGMPIWYRVNGRLIQAEAQIPSEEMVEMLTDILSERQRKLFDAGKDADFAIRTSDSHRQRVNVFRQQKKVAAMIEHMNQVSDRHIITIEDPVEYVYENKKSLIHQREVGEDVESFAAALRSALREDPDVILVGEMRDYETIQAALLAAETGHLVLSTLHTTSATQTVERIIDACPTSGQNQVRIQLAGTLKGIISQCLIPCEGGMARVAATELLTGTDAILNLVREGKTHQIGSIMQTSGNAAMHTLNMDLSRLVKQGYISRENALAYTNNKAEIQQYL
ncbi:MAG: type IV pilus twitching motility protein PilT [Coprococcus comes]